MLKLCTILMLWTNVCLFSSFIVFGQVLYIYHICFAIMIFTPCLVTYVLLLCSLHVFWYTHTYYIYTHTLIYIDTYKCIYILLAAHRCDLVMADSNSDHDDSDVELEIATTYVQLCIDYVQKYYMKRPMCSSLLSCKSYI